VNDELKAHYFGVFYVFFTVLWNWMTMSFVWI